MGIISGFLGGASKGMADAGKMMFTDKIATERDEANALRTSSLQQQATESEQEFKSSEAEKRDVAAMERTKYTADTKAAAGGDKPTSSMRDAAALRKKGYPDAIADAAAHGAFEEIKDADTGDMVLINTLTNKPVGRLTTIGNKKQWLPEGQEPELAEITSAHRKAAKAAAGEKAGYFSTDVSDFPETKGDRKAWIKEEAQRLANEERASKKGDKKAGGIIGGAMDKEVEEPVKDAAKEVKMIGKRQITKQQYIDAMVKKHGADKMAAIEKQWQEYKQ